VKRVFFKKSILTITLLFLALSIFAQQKPMYMWFDCEANFIRLSYPDSISFYFDKLKKLGFTDVVADVKAITGETLFKSSFAPYMQEWGGFTRADNYDMLEVFISEAHKKGLRVHASLNVFCGAHLYLERGIIYDNHPEWQSQVYTPEGIFPITKVKPNYNGMLNPALPEVRRYELDILKEIVTRYHELDGIILDRVRFDGITSDFSQASKEMFEKYAGVIVQKFPSQIFSWSKNKNGNYDWKPGRYFNKWVEWRASLIYTFIADVKAELKDIKPDLKISDYAGSWYPVYYEVGVNWASNKYDASQDYSWATKEYKNYGYAELLDELQLGLYYTEITIDEVTKRNSESLSGRTEAAMGKGREYWYSVEGAAKLSREVTKDAVPVIGSIYADQFGNDSVKFSQAVNMALNSSDGLMVFDIVHVIKRNWWDALNNGIVLSSDSKH